MTMRYCVQIGDSHPTRGKSRRDDLATFAEVNTIYNNWNTDSEVSKLNALLAYEKVEISENSAVFLNA